MFKTKNIALAGLFIAMGVMLPMAFHTIPNAGSIFLPMHIPVLLCGLVLGWQYGLICGMATPVISSFTTGMPPAAILPGMLVELAVYGMVAGLLVQVIRSKHDMITVYGSLIGAMLAGRLAAGITKALIFNVGSYSMQVWITSSFVTALPGIVIQLTAIPILIISLQKAKVISSIVVSE